MDNFTTKGRITIMLGKYQHTTGRRLSPRRLAQLAEVPKDLVYRLDAGEARYVDLHALARLCYVLDCRVEDILVWDNGPNPSQVNELGDGTE
ncbi:MAG: helix-turn-helix transcriptional regulator [Anaerolineae bacterium]|nr:helix-turn-helix transcriptional regulator [Anaerolineae bacterium]MCB9106883.1 helix-turn-helix transcriptional regulator [Anaerolineales bacterium]